MTKGFLRKLSATFALTIGAISSSVALTVPELQRLLQASPPKTVAFAETRESPWLSAPAETRGTMISRPGSLEKHVEVPREETWRMLPDRVEYEGPSGTGRKQILFSQSPAVAVLANALRLVVAGDLIALGRDFQVDIHGDQRAWTARLTPTAGEAARYLDLLQLEGAGSELRVITVVELHGDRTTTRLFP